MGPIGRVLRFLLGGYLLLLALPYYFFVGVRVNFLGSTYFSNYSSVVLALTATIIFLIFYLLVHRASTTFLRDINPWLGAVIANIPPLTVFVISAFLDIGFLQITVFTYVGLSMVLAGWRKDEGCEVMSPANAVMRSTTHFACVIFSPIDWVERKSRDSSGSATSDSPGPITI
jgi:hypothetical protein